MAEPKKIELEILEKFKPLCQEINKEDEKFRKEFRKKVLRANERQFPLSATKLVTKTDNCRIFLSYQANKRGDHDKPNIARFGVFDTNYGMYAIIWTYPYFYTIFRPHMFDRFQERVIKEPRMNREDLIVKYITSNWGQTVLRINDKIEEVYNCFEGHYDNDTFNYVAANNYGYLFGDIHNNGMLSIVRTIITEDMLSENQRKLFPLIKDLNNKLKDKFYEECILYPSKVIRYIK